MDEAALARAVSKAVGSETIEVVDWCRDSIHAAFNQSTGGVYRITGTGRDGSRMVPWSVILKIVHASDDPFGGGRSPSGSNYWKREAEIYRSGILEDLPSIRAPRCFGVEDVDASTAVIWLEDVAARAVTSWPARVYHVAARALGRYNGAYLTERPLPNAPALSRGWLRTFVNDLAPAFTDLPALGAEPIARRCWPGGLFEALLSLWEDRKRLLDGMDALPKTFCHLDAFPGNLALHENTGDVVALDWSYAGIGGVGTELAPVVAASVAFNEVEPDQAWHLDRLVFEGYLDGLRAAGWRGERDLVRFAACASAALHYGLFPIGAYLADEALRARFERIFERPAQAIADRWAALLVFLFERADEARRLLG
jgi:hypothetical protein